MPDVLFCHNGWNFIDHPPYAGEWWAVTRHRTVEMVTVDLKDPDHLGKADPFLTATPDPYIYVFGQAGGKLVETIATRRWTHWMPVLPPEPPLDFDPVASGLADPSPGPRLATFRLDPGHGAPAGPHRTVEHELERRAKPLDEIGLDWRAVAARRRQEENRQARMRAELDKELEQLDREDASAYKPVDLPAGPGEGCPPAPPADLMARVEQIAAYVASLGGAAREREYARMKAANPVVFALLRAFVNELRRKAGEDRAA